MIKIIAKIKQFLQSLYETWPQKLSETENSLTHQSSKRKANISGIDFLRKKREVRVFVSSTFRDMQAERDILVKQVFPELRKLCRSRGVEFVEVDLRWGITEEQAEHGEVLPVCLREIELCRPYFIGLLGERYGWVPDGIEAELLELYPWLKEHLNHRANFKTIGFLLLKFHFSCAKTI